MASDFTSLTPEEVSNLATPTKEYAEASPILRNDFSLDLDWNNDAEAISTLRKFVTIQEQMDQKDPAVQEEMLTAPAQDGFSIPLRVFRPIKGSSENPSPLIVLFYGGGFVLGSPQLMAKTARALVKQFNAVVVAPSYRLAPEYPFPIPLNDGWDAVVWVAENASTTFRADPCKGFIVGGISAGGSVTIYVSHMARDTGLEPPLTGCWLSVPSVRIAPKDANRLPQKYRERLLSETQEDAVKSATLPPGMRKLIDRSYQRDSESHVASPMFWPSPQGKDFGEFGHRGLPRTYSQVCGADTGRDSLLIYDDMLKNEGIPTRLDIYPGLPHAFWTPFKQLPESKKWEQDTMNGFAWLLEK